ncbi:hypothetical protein X778_26695 [Pseudomonas aeruginosa VRFPA07]|nr:hypothetical protein X778_26695 [Pseudomonas aeruginosa VRFPA07]
MRLAAMRSAEGLQSGAGMACPSLLLFRDMQEA